MPIYSMIYLGKFGDIDVDESTITSEYATHYFAGKSFGTATDPLHGKLVDVSLNDADRDGLLLVNNFSGTQEKVSYTLPDGQSFSREIDGAFTAREVVITRLLPNGTTDAVRSTVRVMQDTAGNVFMMPPPLTYTTTSEVAAVTTYPIVGIKLPTASFFKTDYNAAYAGRYAMANFVPCFVAGTLILTDHGELPVEDLRPGDRVWTRDDGYQPVRWCGRRDLGAADLTTGGRLMPIRIMAGALGPGCPRLDLMVSPQHRVLIRSAIARRMFGADELLIAARQLTAVPGIDEVSIDDLGASGRVTYVHIMFDRHQVVLSNGAETESFLPGAQAMQALGPAAEEILTLFPELRDDPAIYPAARPLAPGRRARQLAARHASHDRPLIS